MANLSKIKRDSLIDMIENLKMKNKKDEDTTLLLNEIINELTGKKYGLVWELHEENVDKKMETAIPVFDEIKEREICGNPDDKKINFLLEGDNLHSLKLLEKTHKGRIDVIYIDPPYNTGNSFTYNDENIELNDNYRHSKWISFMAERLEIARNLLSEQGIIFISIDDNEQANLKLLCDSIFDEKNFFAQIIVQSNKRGQTYKQIAKTHEYILIYTKTPEAEFNEILKSDDDNDLNLVDNIGNFNIRELRNRNPKFGKHNRPNLFYPFYVNPNVVDKDGFSPVSVIKSSEYNIEVFPYNSKNEESCWRWGKELSKDNYKSDTLDSNLVAKIKKDGKYNIYEKYRKTTYKAKSIWNEIEMITEKGTVQLGEMDLAEYFDFPKPIELVKKCLQIGTRENSIVLDFFAGSGTTGQAVMELNAEDGSNRKFILCTNNEIKEDKLLEFQEKQLGSKPQKYTQKQKKELSQEEIIKRDLDIEKWEKDASTLLQTEECQELGICRSATYQRLKTVITGETIKGNKYSDGIPANLKYYKTDFVDKYSDDPDYFIEDKLMENIVEMIQLENGIRIDNDKYVVLLTDEEAEEFESNIDSYHPIKIYIDGTVFLSQKIKNKLDTEGVEILPIPDYYFAKDIKGGN